MKLLSHLAPRPPRRHADIIVNTGMRRFIEHRYRQPGLVWIAADELGRYAILRQNRIPLPLAAGPLWRSRLQRPQTRGVMIAGCAAAEKRALDAVRAELERIGREDLPVTRFFGQKMVDWWCLNRRNVPVHFISPELGAGMRPERLVVILAAPRTGSSMVADLLHRAGLLPLPPREVFNTLPDRYVRHGFFERDDLVRRYVELNTSADGLCGVKMQGLQFRRMLREYGTAECTGYEDLLRAARVIRLRRQDRIAQTVSFCRAQRDNIWHRPRDRDNVHQIARTERAVSDTDLLANLRRMDIEERLADFAAARFFRPENVLHLAYEDVSADIGGAVRHMADHLGETLDEDVIRSIEPRTIPTREAYADDLAERLSRLVA